eukprot:TRINITY_DN1089_c0_g1_i1.p1 TRINITY_DN1089_c0_g1~~TRINITY_DN1089_c0_g1_i1.p1  ORF type:complete len:433 (+),score=72.39 TRINITY_DN1089_c0_g1_i1:137-1435(+)
MTALAHKLSIDQVDFKNKRVFVRLDLNVPVNKKTRKIEDTLRIVESLPTIKYVLDHGAKSVVIASHFGRPGGKVQQIYSLRPILPILINLLGQDITFISDPTSVEANKICANPESGSIFLLENLRFYLEEEGRGFNQRGRPIEATAQAVQLFRSKLSQLADVYVNDAFGTVHRSHSSIVGIDLPIRAAGFLLKKELVAFSHVLENPKRPFLAILGGSKVADKIMLIDRLLDRVDELIFTGGMMFTFLKQCFNMEIGASIFDEKGAKLCDHILAKAKKKGVNIHFPIDFIAADRFSAEAKVMIVNDKDGIPEGWIGMDHGPRSCAKFAPIIWRAKTIVLNGPAGVFEFPTFMLGTLSTIQAVAAASHCQGAVSIIGGGDSAAAVTQFGFDSSMTHVSTGGGASLSLLEGRQLPGIAALSDGKSEEVVMLRSRL